MKLSSTLVIFSIIQKSSHLIFVRIFCGNKKGTAPNTLSLSITLRQKALVSRSASASACSPTLHQPQGHKEMKAGCAKNLLPGPYKGMLQQ